MKLSETVKFSFSNFLEGYDRGTALLPATQHLWHKNKITVDDARKVWKTGTIQICRRGAPYVFLHGSGKSDGYKKAGEWIQARHDQTMKSLGELEVVGVIEHGEKPEDDKVTSGKMSLDEIKKIKAPLWVYK